MKYNNLVQGVFHRRLNRFVAEVYIDDHLEQAHVKNTGRLKELLQSGVKVLLETSNNPNRKTKYSLIMVNKNGRWINIDSNAPNFVAYDAIKDGKILELGQVNVLKREVTFGNSRFDLYFETDEEEGFIEVKGVTLEIDGIAMFPDAPTTRGTKHIYELIKAVKAGYRCAILFIVQMKGIKGFKPNKEMDQSFAKAIDEARKQGVEVWVYDSIITEEKFMLDQPVPFIEE